LVVEALANEILVYDLERDKAHCLNETAAWVWKHCDGKTSVAQMAALVRKEINVDVDERVIWFALAQFERHHLLKQRATPPPMMAGITRREMVRALALAAFVSVPLITSIVAPTAVQASTCTASGGACTTGATCCSLVCQANNTCL
jgi:hypothetical protein